MTTTLDELRKRYLDAQLRGDRREATRLVVDEGTRAGFAPVELVEHVIEEAQREIGRLWQENRISIADEHMATAISNVALSELYARAQPAPRNGKRALVACVDGELHELPARLVADALDLAGFDVRYLGASVPPDALLTAVERDRPDLLALSVTVTFNTPALRVAVSRIAERFGDARPIIAVGGGACTFCTKLAAQVGADIGGATANDLVRAAKERLAR